MTIRPYRDDDASTLAALLQQSVKGLAGAFYSPVQVAAWMEVLPDEDKIRQMRKDGRDTFLFLSEDGAVQAFTDIESDGHIDYLYAVPSAAGQGVASQLYDHLEAFAIRQGMTRLYTEASEHACRFFLKKGFDRKERREFSVAGTAIHNFAMEKILQP